MYGNFFFPVHEDYLTFPTSTTAMDMGFMKKYQPVPKAEPDYDTGSNATVTTRRRRYSASLFFKRNLATITISSLLLTVILLFFAIVAILTFEPLR